MASKSTTLEELQSLRRELSAAQQGRTSRGAPSPPTDEASAEDRRLAPTGPAAPAAHDDAASSEKPADNIGELMTEAARFLEERDGEMAAHPLAMAIGGLVVGMIIGRLLARR